MMVKRDMVTDYQADRMGKDVRRTTLPVGRESQLTVTIQHLQEDMRRLLATRHYLLAELKRLGWKKEGE